ncbi:MAG: metallophosphoesterase family protein [Lachnospiraceae bacterium]|nr:metallophosphoesterase family protein [Lachnospiraceae bacterium]
MKKSSRRRGLAFLCLLVAFVFMLSGCKKKEPEDTFVPDEVQVQEGEGDEAPADSQQDEGQSQALAEVPQASGYTAPEEDQNVSYVVLGVGSDETQAVFTWYSRSQNTGKAIVGKASEMSESTFPVTALTAEANTRPTEFDGYNANTATVTGLEPDTAYCYMVGNEEGWSAMYRFHTAKSGELNVVVTGDIQLGTGDDDAVNVENWKRIASETAERFPDYSMHLNMGDITTMPYEEHYINVLDTPMFTNYETGVVLGNHDYGIPYQEHFSRPNQSDFGVRNDAQNGNFWFRYGDVLFMELNYMIETDDIMVDHRYFIKQTLEANPDCKWKVVLMHYSPFSSVAKYQAYSDQNRSYWLQVFDEFGIDVVLNGHDHAYTRSYIVKDGQPRVSDVSSVTNPDGTLYVTFSSASGSQYHDVSPTGFAAKCLQTYTPHVSTINFTDHTFKLTVYEADTWNVLDEFEIVKE